MSRENDVTIEVYEKYGQNYLRRNATAMKDDPKAKIDDEWQAKLFEEYTKDLPLDAKIFEVGSGSGRDAKTLRRLGFRNVVVSDVADFFIEHLMKEGLSPIKFNLISDEFPTEYDAIVCWAVLVHFTKPEAVDAMRKMYNALRPGGKLMLGVKHKAGHEEEWEDYQGRIGAKRYFTYWDREELTKVLEEIGFGEISIEQRGGARSCWLNCCAKKV